MQAVEIKIRENRRFTINPLSLEFPDVSWSVVYKIVTEDLNFKKLCSLWVIGMLSKGILPLHDNAKRQTSHTTPELIEYFGWEILNHAPYSSDIAPIDFNLFWYPKHSLDGKRLSDNEIVEAAVNPWLSDQVTDFFEEGFET
ncbi:histone-lysine N-methyltransferase SETMAR [Trichonephila clavipes]|nr:histone-lysine N-methyltransferase SETMAR [Trichonephila clavipes]